MKGVSAVIAIILILMITVALAAMSYVWFTNVFQSLTGSASGTVNETGKLLATTISIDSSAYISGSDIKVSVRNSGTTSIPADTLGFYIRDIPATVTVKPSGDIAPGTIGYFTVQNTSEIGSVCPGPMSVKVTVKGFEKIRSIAC